MVAIPARKSIKDFPTKEKLGTFKAQSGDIEARLKLGAQLAFIAVIDPGTDFYRAQFEFARGPKYMGGEPFKVTAQYETNVFGEIFETVKKAEEGFEAILSQDRNWRGTRDVMRCIFALEDQVAHIPEQRQKAAQERNLAVYGTRNPERD